MDASHAAPVTRQLRPRKPPPPPPPSVDELGSDEEIRGRGKRRKTASRSAVPGSELTEMNGTADDADGRGSRLKKGRKVKGCSVKRNPQADAGGGEKKKIKIKKKKRSRSVVKGDVGGVEMEGEEGDDDEPWLNEEEEEDAQEETGAEHEEKVRVAQSNHNAQDAEFVGAPVDDAEASKRWPHRYRRMVYFLPLFFLVYLIIV